MISKILSSKTFRLLICLIAGLSFTSCTDFLKGKAKKDEVIQFQIMGAGCYKGLSDKVNKVKDLEASPQEVDELFTCVQNYLTQFQSRVNGELVADVYQASDLRYITERFFKDQNIDEATIEILLKFKQGLVGGASDSLTKSEVSELKKFMLTVHKEFNLLYKFRNLYDKNAKTVVAKRGELESLYKQIKLSAQKVVGETAMWETEFTFDDALVALRKFNIISDKNDHDIEIIKSVRSLITAGKNITDRSEFLVATDNFADMAYMFVLNESGYAKFEIKSAEGVDNLVYFVETMVNSIGRFHSIKTDGQIDLKYMDGFIKGLLEKGMIPIDVPFDILRDFYRTALSRAFDMQNRTTAKASYFTPGMVHQIRKELAVYKLHNKFVKNLTETSPTCLVTYEQLKAKLSTYINEKHPEILSGFSSAESVELRQSVGDMYKDYFGKYPIIVKNKKYIIDRDVRSIQLSWEDLSRALYIKMLARELHKGWGNLLQNKNALYSSVVTKKQYILFRDEFQPFGIALKLVDPRSKSVGESSFLEANLFTFASNGDEYLSFEESERYLTYLITDGAWNASTVKDDLKTNGCNLTELDVFGYPMNNHECVFNTFKQNYRSYFSGKPELLKFLNTLSPNDFRKYFEMMAKFAIKDESNFGKKLETIDIQTIVVAASYVETLFVQFDTSKNLKLSAEEFRTGYPRFESFVRDYAHKNMADSIEKWEFFLNPCRMFYSTDDVIRESFIFMALNDGQIPEEGDFNILTCAVRDLITHKNEVDRLHMLYTFIELKSILASY